MLCCHGLLFQSVRTTVSFLVFPHACSTLFSTLPSALGGWLGWLTAPSAGPLASRGFWPWRVTGWAQRAGIETDVYSPAPLPTQWLHSWQPLFHAYSSPQTHNPVPGWGCLLFPGRSLTDTIVTRPQLKKKMWIKEMLLSCLHFLLLCVFHWAIPLLRLVIVREECKVWEGQC